VENVPQEHQFLEEVSVMILEDQPNSIAQPLQLAPQDPKWLDP
jgi:hypothetical protein